MSIAEVITLSIAIVGAALGIINTFHIVSRDKIKLLIKPVWITTTVGPVIGDTTIGIEVINLSFVPVTIREVGFDVPGNIKFIPRRPWTTDGGPYPRELEPRTSFTVVFDKSFTKSPNFENAICAFARTACGIKFKSTSSALKQVKKGTDS